MSTSIQPASNPPRSVPKGVLVMMVVLALAVAVCATTAIVFAVLYFRPAAAGGVGGGGGGGGEAPLVQGARVAPQSNGTGIVYYPIPYGSPPNLKLSSPKRQYNIVKQDETGFTWTAEITLDDFRDDQRKNGEARLSVGVRGADGFQIGFLKPNLQFEEFTWEAKGMRAGKDAADMKVFPQEGAFNTLAGEKGEVNFPIPYAAAPNVELSGQASGSVVIVECRPTLFKWKNTPQTGPFAVNSGSVTWKAKGIRATELPKSNP